MLISLHVLIFLSCGCCFILLFLLLLSFFGLLLLLFFLLVVLVRAGVGLILGLVLYFKNDVVHEMKRCLSNQLADKLDDSLATLVIEGFDRVPGFVLIQKPDFVELVLEQIKEHVDRRRIR